MRLNINHTIVRNNTYCIFWNSKNSYWKYKLHIKQTSNLCLITLIKFILQLFYLIEFILFLNNLII